MKKQKFFLFKYSTENVGDEVQSIAARCFLPSVSGFVDRDQKIDFSSVEGASAKIIMNGWYTHKPENWPPSLKGINPLLISMYVDQKTPEVVRAFTSKESKEFFERFGPVGARDKSTLRFLQSHGIDSYFSGCLTLTLKRDSRFPRGDFVLLVDVSKELEEKIRASTDRPVVSISVYRTPELFNEDKFALAEYYLYLYQSAHAVVTTRLHVMLPCLAFETPVALVKEKDKFEPKRYDGLVELVHSFEDEELLKNPKLFDVNDPPKNKPDYKSMREQLTKKCLSFTGHQSETYITIDLPSIYKSPSFMRIVGTGVSATYRELLRIGDVGWLNRVADDLRGRMNIEMGGLQDRVARIESELAETQIKLSRAEEELEDIKKSISWKISTPFRAAEERIRRLL